MNFRFSLFLVYTLATFLFAPFAEAVTLRIVCYNIEADVNGDTAPNAGLDTVLEAIGEQNVNGVAQPLDVLTLEETTSNSATVAPIVADLNSYYGAGTYAASAYQGTETGNSPGTGNGPNALIYNTTTLTLVESVGVGTPEGSTNGEYRQVIRYKLQPVAGTSANAFYLYVSHMKSSASGSTSAVQTDRNEEAQIIRADSAALAANACVLYMGDFNLDGSSEACYQTMTAAGANQGVDPLNNNPQNDAETWHSSTYAGILTESATALGYRDDIQFVGANVFAGSVAGGLQFLPGSFRAFGNNGTTAYEGSVNSSSNTALNNLSGPITASQALAALTTASDHLPVVADYAIDLTGTEGTLQFSATNYPIDEDAGSVLVTVDRTGGSSGAVSVAYTTADGTAVAGTDYTAKSGTLNWADGDTAAKTFSIPISDRKLTDGSSRTLDVTLSGPTAGATLGAPAQATVTILENDATAGTPGTLQFNGSSYSVNEDAGTLVATVNRSGGSAGAVSVAYATSNGTAVAGTDYTAKSGTLTWAAGDTTPKTFTIAIIDRGLTDGSSRALDLTLSNPAGGASLGTLVQSVVTILENDAPVGALQFSAASYSSNESAGTLAVTVDRTGGSAGAVTVVYATTNGTASAPADYTAKTGTLTWAAGDASAKTFVIAIIDRGLTDNSSRTLNLTLSAPSGGASLGTPSTAVVTILENDTAEGTLQLAEASYAVNEDAGSVMATVTRTDGSTGAVSVAYQTSNGTAVAGTDYTATSGTLNWATGDVQAKTLTVPIIDRRLTDDSSRTLSITLSKPGGGAALGSTAQAVVTILENDSSLAAPVITSSVDAAGRVARAFTYQIRATNSPSSYAASGLPNGLEVNAKTGVIGGEPKAAGTFQVTLSATNTGGTGSSPLKLTIEHSRPAVRLVATVPVAYVQGRIRGHFTITREGDLTEPLTVHFTIKGTARNGVDYVEIPRERTFKGGRASRKIVIVPKDEDEVFVGARSVVLKLMPADAYTLATHKKVTVEIHDDR